MKKITFIFAISLISLASCKKTYTCDCKATLAGTTNIRHSIVNSTKKNAKVECDNLEYNQDAIYKANDGSYICDLQ